MDGLKIVSFALQGDTIRLKLDSPLAALPTPYDQPYGAELRIVGLPAGEYQLVINDGPPQHIDSSRLAHYRISIDPPALHHDIPAVQ